MEYFIFSISSIIAVIIIYQLVNGIKAQIELKKYKETTKKFCFDIQEFHKVLFGEARDLQEIFKNIRHSNINLINDMRKANELWIKDIRNLVQEVKQENTSLKFEISNREISKEITKDAVQNTNRMQPVETKVPNNAEDFNSFRVKQVIQDTVLKDTEIKRTTNI